ncbi:hypothetical protein, unlikely [Trypanosoma brucei gambiense DAL972]|uniref:Uncharacterized protein n=1 Tax=Trypanosoma brucei gambiense (strain MHOM/CI/86/DAL972) TaxID=679716 RepID=C9ZSU3_TRYB9|nr:hypothetical protein, unlikely [Trypanosoma brucei gambiense DAL972]CBH12478.1 hypothetical protein, unlikely [Trypanosoma brucei gambiense DAL972]|eukprot:XP_011774758.1 hypothetical protein, unlikely [Trypanosoma brucei gambiense DAL972]
MFRCNKATRSLPLMTLNKPIMMANYGSCGNDDIMMTVVIMIPKKKKITMSRIHTRLKFLPFSTSPGTFVQLLLFILLFLSNIYMYISLPFIFLSFFLSCTVLFLPPPPAPRLFPYIPTTFLCFLKRRIKI